MTKGLTNGFTKGYTHWDNIILLFICCISAVILYFFNHEDYVLISKVPTPFDNFYVNDYSNVLTPRTKALISKYGKDLYNKTTAQAVVVMVPGTGNQNLEYYSLRLANEWQIGTKGADNGVLLLFTTEGTPHVRLEIGTGLEGDIPDGKAGRILDLYAVPFKDKGQLDSAALQTYAEVLRVLYHKYNLSIPLELLQENIDKLTENSQKQELNTSQELEVARGLDNSQEAENSQDIQGINAPTSQELSTNDNPRNKYEQYELKPNNNPMIAELLVYFICSMFFWGIIKFIIFIFYDFTTFFSNKPYDSDGTGSGSSGSSYRGYSSSGGGSHSSGGGGSFRGGGASR